MLTIECLGGLGNRMRALDSAIALARALGYPITMVWNMDASLGCRFNDLFYPPACIQKIVHRNRKSRIERLLSKITYNTGRTKELFMGQQEVEKGATRIFYDFLSLINSMGWDWLKMPISC